MRPSQSLPVRGAWIEIIHNARYITHFKSLPVRGAWIEIAGRRPLLDLEPRRSPCGERGLKYAIEARSRSGYASLPVRGAWIEISGLCPTAGATPSLPVRGAWIEIQLPTVMLVTASSRSPCGERGLKCVRLEKCGSNWCRSPCGERGLKCL